MNQQDLVAKLNQIVEQAQLTLQDPRSLTAERQKMIIALARFVCSEMSHPSRGPSVPPDWRCVDA
jgi:predicted outer membrane protein